MEYKELQKNAPSLFDNQNAPIEIITDEKKISIWQKERRSLLVQDGKPVNWAEIGVLLDDPYVVVIRDLVKFPGGFQNGYIRLINRADLEGGQAIVVLPVYDKKFQLIYRFRHATRSWHYEVPRGFGESNTTAEQQASNEVKEEIGGAIEKLVDLGVLHNNTGIEGNNVKLFLAFLSSVGAPQQSEAIARIAPLSLAELETKIASGEITDGFTIATYTRAKLRNLI